MIAIDEVIVVEGKYDKIKVEQLFDTLVLTTDGFRLYKDKEKIALLRRLAQQRGLIVLTDSDAAGFRIRGHINRCLGDVAIKHAYVPSVPGKERRKEKHGAEGLLGVEGMDAQVIRDAILAQTKQVAPVPKELVTMADLYALGLTGGKDSAAKRRLLATKMHLPERIPTGALLKTIHLLYEKDEFLQLAAAILGG